MAKNNTDKKLDKQLDKVGGTLSAKELEQIKQKLGITGGVREEAKDAGIKIGDSLVKDKPEPKPTGSSTKPTGSSTKPTGSTAPSSEPGLTDVEKQYYKNQLFDTGTETGDRSVIDINIENLINEENQKKFNYLVQDVLAKTVREVNRNLAKQNNIKYLSNLQGFDEVINFTSNLSNSLLADSGIGGYLAMSGQGAAAKNLEKGVKSMLGQGDSMTYNWQKWFDGELADRYTNLKEITNPEDAKQIHQEIGRR